MFSPSLDASLEAPRGSLRERDTRYYQILAGGARARLLETFLDLRLPELLGQHGRLSAHEICARLDLDPHRGWKFLHLLAMTGLLVEHGGEYGELEARFELSPEAKEYFGGHDSAGADEDQEGYAQQVASGG